MHRIGNLYSQIYSMDNLRRAHECARKDKSLYEAVKKTDENLEERLGEIAEMLRTHTYKVSPYNTAWKLDGSKPRILYKLPYFPDRIIQWAIMLVIEPILSRSFMDFSCASLPDKGVHYAGDLIKKHITEDPVNTQYYLKFDIHKFYPSISHEILKDKLSKTFKDKELLQLLYTIIDSLNDADVSHLHLTEEQKAIYCRPNYGLPVGSYLSQYLANYYLCSFDHWLADQPGVSHIIRYMDDYAIFSSSKQDLHTLFAHINTKLQSEYSLKIKPNHTVNKITEGLDMVGYRFFPHCVLLRNSIRDHMKQLFTSITSTPTPHQWSQCMSYIGMLGWCNSYDFAVKYLYPICKHLNAYYEQVIKGKKQFNAWSAYVRNYRKHNKPSTKGHTPIHKRRGNI